jgi:hypothetical protein
MNDEIDTHDAAVFLQWAGYALIVIYSITVVVEVMPLALLQPAWLVRFSAKILGGGVFALTGAVLLVIALRFDPEVLPLSRFQKRLRQLARFVALGFLLLIPLQMIAGFFVLNTDAQDIQRKLAQLESATEVISKSNTETGLINGLALLPGAPKPNGQKLSIPAPIVKAQVLAQLNRQIPLLQTRIAQVKKSRLETGIAVWFKQGVISAAYAIAFGMLGTVHRQSLAYNGGDPMTLASGPIKVLGWRPRRRRDSMTIPPEWLEGMDGMVGTELPERPGS